MSIYKIKWLEVKNPDWKVLTLTDDKGQELKDVSVNRTNKKGEAFPKFDEIMNAGEIEGEFWTSDAGKNYLFAPKPQRASNPGFKSHQIRETMEIKRTDIAHSQAEKSHAIKVASTFSAAKDAAIAEYQESRRLSATGATLEQLFEKWREYFWLRFDVGETQYPPFVDNK